MQSKNPNRFFGINPVSVASQGPKEGGWSRDLPKTWQDALAGAHAPSTAPDAAAGAAGRGDDD